MHANLSVGDLNEIFVLLQLQLKNVCLEFLARDKIYGWEAKWKIAGKFDGLFNCLGVAGIFDDVLMEFSQEFRIIKINPNKLRNYRYQLTRGPNTQKHQLNHNPHK